jgi:hypothetical protein
MAGSYENGNEVMDSSNGEKFIDQVSDSQFVRDDYTPRS